MISPVGFDEMVWERIKAREATRPLWQKVLLRSLPPLLVAGCVTVVRVENGPSHAAKPVVAVRSACPYVDMEIISTVFGAGDATLTEALESRQDGFTRYTCLVDFRPALALRVDLDVYRGTLGPNSALPALAVSGQTAYSVEDTDAVLLAAKRSDAALYGVTLTGSSNSRPLPEGKLVSLASAITGKLQ